MMRLGAQLFTLRDYTQTAQDLDRSLEQVARMGYQTVQVSAIGPIPAQQVREICDKHGLQVVLTHWNPDRILNDTEAVIEEHEILGCDYIGLGMMPKKYCTPEWLSHFAEDFKEPAKKIAAAGKLMSSLDLITAANKITVTAHCNTTIGLPGTLSCRLQPNHTTDDPDGILASLLEGLTFGAGDAVLGLNPVTDSVERLREILTLFDEVRNRWEIPTQTCVLGHVTTQMAALSQGAPADLIFQSIAGSQKGNEAFGITGALLEEARQMALHQGTATGPNVMYFETGQGSELSSEAHHGADQVTMEARCYGFARRFQPFLVNTVVGFIGPEYLYDARQVIRAGLEDHFMGKLMGLPMGCDACYTNHMKADQNDIENLATLLTAAGCTYFMGIPHGDDVMLNYQTTGFRETATLRRLFGKTATPPFQAWLERMGFVENGRLTPRAGDGSILLKEVRHG